MVKGFLYIKKEPCGIHSFNINCSSVDYSMAFYITHDDEMPDGDGEAGLVTLHVNRSMNYILPTEYNKIETIYPNIKEQLQDKPYLILPIKIQIRTVADTNTSSQVITISKALKTTPKENEEIAKEYKNICHETQHRAFYTNNPSNNRIYTHSKDMYVNVREKPNNNSHIITQMATQYPNAKLTDSMYWEYDNLKYQYVPNKSWINKRQIYLDNNTQVNFIEKLYMKNAWPINNWYEVYFIDKTGKKIEGYIHKSQLSWGF